MKKIIFGILSLLLISSVFAEDISPAWSENVAISFESSSQNQNITYYIYGNPWNNNDYTITNLLFVDSTSNLQFVPSLYYSLNQLDSGTTISDYNNIFVFSGRSNITGSLNNRSIFGINLSGSFPLLSQNAFYSQKVNSNGFNYLLSWSSDSVDFNSFGTLSNSYIRYFYNSSLGFSTLSPSYFDISNNPGFVEIFGNAFYTLTNKARVYDYAGKNNLVKSFVIPSLMDGYSYIIGSGDNLSFHTVLPGFSNFITGSNYILPSYLDIEGYLFFKTDGDIRNGNKDLLSVLSKVGDIIYYSNYVCSDFTYTEYDGKYKLNLDTACQFLGGGYITGGTILGRQDVYHNILDVLNKSQFDRSNCSRYKINGDYMSLSFEIKDGSTPFINIRSFFDNSCPSNNFYSGTLLKVGFGLVTDSSINLLSNFDNTAVPPEPLTTGKVEELLDIYCNQLHLINPALCNNNGGPSIGSGAYTYEPVLSGDQVVLVITDYSDTNDYIIHTGEDGEIWIECVGDWCPIYNNTGSSDIGSVGGSGFILDTGYYENFFNKTGYFAKCPYPYTDLQIGEKLKIVQKIKNSIGDFDIFLPINCSIAAFTAGKTYKFLSDVDMGLNPLMGNIQNSEDPRVYLYKFFDFLMSFALIVFLLKIYHLLN